MTVTCALSPIAVAMTETAATAAPTTPTANNRRMHNPYLRAPTPAATTAVTTTTVTTTPAAVALLPPASSPSYQQQSQQQMFLPVVKPVMTHPMAHPMRPQQQLFQQLQQQQSQAASCVYGVESISMMGTPQPSAASMMMMPASMMASSVVSALPGAPFCGAASVTCAPAPAAGMMTPASVAAVQQQQSTNNNVVNVISHKDLSGSALRYVRFTALDGTSAAAPRRDRTTGPYQAPAMPPVINEALMASPEAANLVDVFVSQLPFDLPLQALRALADAVVPGAPIRIAHAAPHQRRNGGYDGCCFVKMPEPDAHRFIAALHKRVLFDVFGLWVASDQAGLEEMTAYCAHMQSLRPDARRRILCRPTPFSAVTAELAKRVYAF